MTVSPRTISRTSLVVITAAAALLAPLLLRLPAADAAETRPFAASSPWNTAIPSAPALDAASAAMVSYLGRDRQAYANLVEFGIPIATASSSTPRFDVDCRMDPEWGTCPFAGRAMPIPAGAEPSSGSDGALVVVDPGTGTTGEYWQADGGSAGWVASWGAVNTLSGSGWGGSSTGSGASRLGGVIRVSEIKAGVINHALAVQSSNVCSGTYRAPALKTDGSSTRSDCVPEGARLQLDPSINVAAIAGITPAERAVARALQVYGAYVIDYGGAPLSVSFEVAPDATAGDPGATYRAAGLGWDYYGMPKVPWTRLRVLKTWRG